MAKIEEFEDPNSRYQNPRYSGKKGSSFPKAWVGNAKKMWPIENYVPDRANHPKRQVINKSPHQAKDKW